MMNKRHRYAALFALMIVAGCTVGPDYKRPQFTVPAAFKELKGWKQAQPRDQEPAPGWWTVFNDPFLNTLQEQVSISNLSLAQAEAKYRQAVALVQGARAGYFPTIAATAAYTRSRQSTSSGTKTGDTTDEHLLSFNAAWEIDIWGRVRRQVEANAAGAQATAADLQALRLSLQSEVAQDYFLLCTLDAQKKIFDDTVAAYQKALQLTRNRYAVGVAAKADIALAMTQLKTTQAQAIDIGIQRAQLEHAIALLIGKAPADFSIPPTPVVAAPPLVPAAFPSDLLERRPDIASAERAVAAANAQIGIAKAAYFPSLTLSASTGYQTGGLTDVYSSSLANLFSVPGYFWSLGPAALSYTLFDGGARRAQTKQAIAAYDATVAAYKQTVLTGFQEVEDNLAALRILDEELRVQEEAVASARESLTLSTNQYKAGIVSYLNVISTQSTALANERTALGIRGQRLTATVLLMKALGGGWNASQLPAADRLEVKQDK